MKLYHYTSIETLALILKHKTIRFSRLDRVDDPDEYSFKEDGITPAHYCYVSCWTKMIMRICLSGICMVILLMAFVLS